MCETIDGALEYLPLIDETLACKRASIVIGFFTYLMHQGITGGIHFLEFKKHDERLIKSLKAFKADIEKYSYFFLVLVMFMQILTPVPFGVALLYLYFFISFPLIFLGHYNSERWWKLRISGIGFQALVMFILLFFVIINPWCRQLYFRYAANN
jgi:hypothetical protein